MTDPGKVFIVVDREFGEKLQTLPPGQIAELSL
jgi:hypothetical protein